MGELPGQDQVILAGRVILAGFMGSGKTAVGRRLAERLAMDFVDTDELAAQRMGMSINEAFAEKGEGFFRSREEEVIRELLSEPSRGPGEVISLGGGAVTTEGVRRMLAVEDNVFLLDIDPETAFGRSQDGERPLASDREEFNRLFSARAELYRQVAGAVIAVGGGSVDEVVEQVIEILERRRTDDSTTG